MTPHDIILAARECLDTPFRHQGRLPGFALDCAGVAVHVARRVGCEPDEPAAYGRLPHGGLLEHWLHRQPFLVRADAPQAGDLLLMRFAAEPQHLAIHAGATIVHAYQAIGRTVEHDLDAKWRRRIVRVYRFNLSVRQDTVEGQVQA